MAVVKSAKIKCPNKRCSTLIYKEWSLGVLPRLLTMGAMFFKCHECEEIFYVSIPMYMIEKFLGAMSSDPTYRDGEFIKKMDPISDDEEKLFIKMLEEKPTDLLQALKLVDNVDLDKFDKE